MIVDTHAHFEDRSVLIFDPSLSHCLEMMDRLSIDCLVQSLAKAIGPGFRPDFEGYIEECKEIFEKSKKRIFTISFTIPFWPIFASK